MSHSNFKVRITYTELSIRVKKTSFLASTKSKQFADRFIGDFLDVVSLSFEFLQIFVKKTKICH